jgi:Tfp pilus assembly protein FimT
MPGKPESHAKCSCALQGALSGDECGLTLVELLVTICIIVFIAVMGLAASFDPKGWDGHTRLKAAANELFFNMHKARAGAVKENKKWAIVFETNNPNRYHICSDSGDGNWSTLPDNTIVQTIDLTSYKHGIGFGAGSATKSATSPAGAFTQGFDFVSFNNNALIFHPSGLPASSGYCYLSNDQKEAYAVGAMTSGVMTVRNWNRNAWR